MCAYLGGNFDPVCLKHNHNTGTPQDEVTEFLPFGKCRSYLGTKIDWRNLRHADWQNSHQTYGWFDNDQPPGLSELAASLILIVTYQTGGVTLTKLLFDIYVL